MDSRILFKILQMNSFRALQQRNRTATHVTLFRAVSLLFAITSLDH